MIKRVLAAAAVAAVPAFAAVALTTAPAAAWTSPSPSVTPGALCSMDQWFTVRPGSDDRLYQCQNHDGWRWVPTEPCPSASKLPALDSTDRRLIPICYPIIYPSPSASTRTPPPCLSSSPTLERLRTLPPICPSASASASSSPRPKTSSSTSSSASASASVSASGGVVVIPSDNGVGDKLPVTGSKTVKIGLLGAAIAAVGAAAVWFARRRRTQFVAEGPEDAED